MSQTNPTNKQTKPKPTQEFNGGSHRLVSKDRRTEWAAYTQITYLDGWVGITAYYGQKEDVLTPHQFVEMIAVL